MPTFVGFAIRNSGTAKCCRRFLRGRAAHPNQKTVFSWSDGVSWNGEVVLALRVPCMLYFRLAAANSQFERAGVIMGRSGHQKHWLRAFVCLVAVGCLGHWIVTDQMAKLEWCNHEGARVVQAVRNTIPCQETPVRKRGNQTLPAVQKVLRIDGAVAYCGYGKRIILLWDPPSGTAIAHPFVAAILRAPRQARLIACTDRPSLDGTRMFVAVDHARPKENYHGSIWFMRLRDDYVSWYFQVPLADLNSEELDQEARYRQTAHLTFPRTFEDVE